MTLALAAITGIQFQLNWLGTTGGPQGTLVNCQLASQGTLIGNQKTPGTISTPVDPGLLVGAGTLIGGNGDTWGATLSPAIVNDPTFGVNFQLLMGTGSFNRLFIDVVYVVIYWSIPSATVQSLGSKDPRWT